jgi:PIN domain nuclease of toxin-antitoxin system
VPWLPETTRPRLSALPGSQRWKAEIFKNTRLKLITPSIDELIQSTQLPEYHKDPFDRILITQTNWHNAKLVTKDSIIPKYDVETFWI